MIKWEEQWVEVLALFFLFLGLAVSVLLRNTYFSYLTVFLAGFLGGRLYYLKHYKEPILPFVLIIIGFLFGYLVGSLWINRIAVLIFFVLGFVISYYLHLKQVLVTFKSKNFIK